MKLFIAILIALAVYFGLGWVIKDITFSIMDINDNTTLEEIGYMDLTIYSCLAGAYIILVLCFLDEYVDSWAKLAFLPLAAFLISRYLIPPSMGSAILFNLLNISGMILVTFFITLKLTDE
ncbi:hypothetical protein [Bacteroides neonati]|uniref:hypothetical protein n=1 Tax=Bacteroides neonati TaxID=1347393 RepID=UPI0005AB2174|nr:hypothetical protein [Bacteroides neonati]